MNMNPYFKNTRLYKLSGLIVMSKFAEKPAADASKLMKLYFKERLKLSGTVNSTFTRKSGKRVLDCSFLQDKWHSLRIN